MRTITYHLQKKTSLSKYVFDFVFDVIGVQGYNEGSFSKSKHVDIFYGSEPISNCEIAIPENESDIIWLDLVEGKILPENIKNAIPFDIINAIGLLLSDHINNGLPNKAYDTHDRVLFAQSYQAKNQVAHLPLVNFYVQFLKRLFEEKLAVKSIPLWPSGKRSAIGLSHDVDKPKKYAFLNNPYFSKNLSSVDNLLNNLTRVRDSIKRKFDPNPDDFWLFEEIMEAEDCLGFKSTFFFASMNQFCDWASPYDVLYDIKEPDFVEMFREIIDRGFEIGLHASYNAHENSLRFRIEKEKLEEIAGCKVSGVRHHFWHTGRNIEQTLLMHEEAGFEYDSSIAFNESLSFRRNIALPYRPWDSDIGRAIQTIQLPVFCMDGHLFYRPTEVEAAVAKLKDYLRVIKEREGLGVIDWHVRTSFPKNTKFRDWGKAYLRILEYLSEDDEVWVTGLGNINAWLRKRRESMYDRSKS